MLVLTRKLMEKIYIGEDICVTIVRLEGGQVRLGIDAPRSIPVVRAELKDKRSQAATRVDSPEVAGPTVSRRPVPLGNGIRRRELSQ
jgi:carbon storage regulator